MNNIDCNYIKSVNSTKNIFSEMAKEQLTDERTSDELIKIISDLLKMEADTLKTNLVIRKLIIHKYPCKYVIGFDAITNKYLNIVENRPTICELYLYVRDTVFKDL